QLAELRDGSRSTVKPAKRIESVCWFAFFCSEEPKGLISAFGFEPHGVKECTITFEVEDNDRVGGRKSVILCFRSPHQLNHEGHDSETGLTRAAWPDDVTVLGEYLFVKEQGSRFCPAPNPQILHFVVFNSIRKHRGLFSKSASGPAQFVVSFAAD